MRDGNFGTLTAFAGLETILTGLLGNQNDNLNSSHSFFFLLEFFEYVLHNIMEYKNCCFKIKLDHFLELFLYSGLFSIYALIFLKP